MAQEDRYWPPIEGIVEHITHVGGDEDIMHHVADMASRLEKVEDIVDELEEVDELYECNVKRNKIINAIEIMAKDVDMFSEKQKEIQKYINVADCETIKEVVELVDKMAYVAHEEFALIPTEESLVDVLKRVKYADALMAVTPDVVLYYLRRAVE